jgi:hypothetical protein
MTQQDATHKDCIHISNVESLGYIIKESAMICKKTF